MSKKSIALFIACLLFSGLILLQLTVANSTPSVPQFTIKQVDRSYDVPTTYSKNQYTGETITHQGYHVQNLTLDIIIKNQPFTPSTVNGTTIGLYYNVEAKLSSDKWSNSGGYGRYAVKASTSDDTAVTIVMGSDGLFASPGSQVDIRVQAVSGYEYTVWTESHIQPIGTQFILDQTSSWSNTQTVTIGESIATTEPTNTPAQFTPTPTQTMPTTSPTQQPTATPQNAEQPQTNLLADIDWEKTAIVGLVVAVAVLAVSMAMMWRKRSRK